MDVQKVQEFKTRKKAAKSEWVGVGAMSMWMCGHWMWPLDDDNVQ
jgi:hypothetical protein